MNVAKLRELSGAINSAEHLSDVIGSPLASLELITTEQAGDALTWAAGEIERLEKERGTWESRWHITTAAASAADADSTVALNDAAETIGRLMLQVERLKEIARDGWETAKTLADGGPYASTWSRANNMLETLKS